MVFVLVDVLHYFAFLPSRRLLVCAPAALAFPCFVSGLLALPLCGAAPTFLCLPQRKATVLEVKW
ncbi:MAG: hypothetical protein WBR17_42155 [Paraburkholderia sp.]|uniref:hypothetical protein n=1 Tax=Paraburkholderia sp. TaxID=1926495 RepID=UPI003C512FF6